ncbi:HEAT repeat domain-containing protein [Planctomicrobium sp. SH527]|uniref:HEAT repeat domain-containing protein n=1 Tax=Planctomicrobium sp. SH527 TaxID=3448123 RepID=UPI003F5BF313
MAQTRKIVVLGLSVIALAVGCTTAPAIVSTQTPVERTQRLLAIAEEYDKKGQSQAALRIYDHLLIQQPNHREAQERRQLLAERTGLPSSMINDPRHVYASRSSSGRNTNAMIRGPVPTSAVPDNSQKSIDAELKAAALLRPVSPAENYLQFAGTIEAAGPETNSLNATSELRQVSAAVSENEQKTNGRRESVSEQADSKATKPLQPVTYSPEETSEADEGRWKKFNPKSSERHGETAVAEPLFSDLKATGLRRQSNGDSLLLLNLEQRMDSSSRTEQVEALCEAAELKVNSPVVLDAIRGRLADEDILVRIHAAWAFRAITGDDEVSLRILRDCLSEKNESVCCLAIYLIGEIGTGAAAATPDLVELRDGTHGVPSLYASEALMKVSPADLQSINVLKAALASNEQQVRWGAATLLGNATGVFQVEAATALKSAIQDEDIHVSVAACLSLGGFGSYGGVALEELQNAADFGNQDVRFAAAIALDCLHDKQGSWAYSVAKK